MTNHQKFVKWLRLGGACNAGIAYVKQHALTATDLVKVCNRPAWLLWLWIQINAEKEGVYKPWTDAELLVDSPLSLISKDIDKELADKMREKLPWPEKWSFE